MNLQVRVYNAYDLIVPHHIDGLVQDSSALSIELPQSYTKPPIHHFFKLRKI